MNDNLFLLFHLSTGDNFTMYAMVLHYQKIYKNVYIFCLYRNHEFITQLYAPYKNIHIFKINDPSYNACVVSRDFFKQCSSDIKNYDTIATGFMNSKWTKEGFKNFYMKFYEHIGLDYNIRYLPEYSKINRNIQIESQLYEELIKIYGKTYIFVHDHRNYIYHHKNIRPNVIVNTDMPIFHPNYNYYNDYPKHKYYSLWNNKFYINNLLNYCTIIENATEIHISDSSFSCLCPYLDLTKVKNKCVYTTLDMKEYHSSFNDWNIVKSGTIYHS